MATYKGKNMRRERGIYSCTRVLRDFLGELVKSKIAVIGGIIIILVILISISFTSFWHVNPNIINLKKCFIPPVWVNGGSWQYPLGTDNLGRCVLTRLLYGARVSLTVSFSAMLLGSVLGIFLGLVSGYYGGKLDNVIMRIADIFLAYPFTLLTISLIAVLGPSIRNVIIILAISDWVIYARTVRGMVLSIKEKSFIEVIKSMGATKLRIIMCHILPNVIPSLIVLATVRVAAYIIWESGLSFLGIGVPPPAPTWGRMLSEGRQYITTAWWLVTFPGVAIMVVVLGWNMLGDGLRDILDPSLRHLR